MQLDARNATKQTLVRTAAPAASHAGCSGVVFRQRAVSCISRYAFRQAHRQLLVLLPFSEASALVRLLCNSHHVVRAAKTTSSRISNDAHYTKTHARKRIRKVGHALPCWPDLHEVLEVRHPKERPAAPNNSLRERGTGQSASAPHACTRIILHFSYREVALASVRDARVPAVRRCCELVPHCCCSAMATRGARRRAERRAAESGAGPAERVHASHPRESEVSRHLRPQIDIRCLHISPGPCVPCPVFSCSSHERVFPTRGVVEREGKSA